MLYASYNIINEIYFNNLKKVIDEQEKFNLENGIEIENNEWYKLFYSVDNHKKIHCEIIKMLKINNYMISNVTNINSELYYYYRLAVVENYNLYHMYNI